MELDLIEYAYFVAFSGCPVLSSERKHTGTRWTLSVNSEYVYKDNIWVSTSVGRNDCAIFRCATKFGPEIGVVEIEKE